MKFRLEHETVGFEYKIDDLTAMHAISQVSDFVLGDSGYKDLPQVYRILLQTAVRTFITYLQSLGARLDLPKGSDPVVFLLKELPILANDLGVMKNAVLTFGVSETNDSPTITTIQLQL